MVWIHGGAFVMGTGASFLYHGARLARRGDVVVVTINYRLGALGFLNHPELRARGIDANLGIRDQIRALEWVRENIAAFGGDPGNVTIFGESAGGMSVGTLLAAPAARGLFHRAILQSGALHHVASEAQAARVAEAFLDALGLDARGRRGAALCAHVARSSARSRSSRCASGSARALMPWQPSVDGDCLPRTALEALDRGEVARVPTLVGSNRDEWRLFTLFDPRSRGLAEPEMRRRLARQLGSEQRRRCGARGVPRGAARPPLAGAALGGDAERPRLPPPGAARRRRARRARRSGVALSVLVAAAAARQPARRRARHGAAVRVRHAARRDPAPHARRVAQRAAPLAPHAATPGSRSRATARRATRGCPSGAPTMRTSARRSSSTARSALIHAPFASESEFWRPRLG